MITKAELFRRAVATETRLDTIDQRGTRGVDAIKVTIEEQASDIADIRRKVDALSDKVDRQGTGRAARYIAFATAILPVYILLFLAVFHVHT